MDRKKEPLLNDKENRVHNLQTKIDEGIESGIAEDFDPEAFEQQMIEKYNSYSN